jgi:hypothetical protein
MEKANTEQRAPEKPSPPAVGRRLRLSICNTFNRAWIAGDIPRTVKGALFRHVPADNAKRACAE